MDGSNIPMAGAGGGIYPSSYSKFNNALNAGLLNPMSPPPPPLSSPSDKLVNATTRSSPTLFEMMANEHESVAAVANVMNPTTRPTSSSYHVNQSNPSLVNGRQQQHPPPLSVQERQLLLQERVMDIMGCSSPGSQLNDPETSDVHLTLSSKDGLSITINVHRQILVAHSRFFAAKLTDRWSKQQRSLPHLVEISDCDDVEIYVETLRLMYCSDIRRRLLREDVPKILSVLKVCAAISFDAGVLSCLEYLEAAPWAEDEEEKVAGLLSQLHLESSGAAEVLKRVMPHPLSSPLLLSSTTTTGGEEPINGNGSCAFNLNGSEEVLLRLLQVVLEGKDEKARREMKDLVSKMLRENNKNNSSNNNGGNNNSNNLDVSQDSLYVACEGCLNLLRHHFTKAATSDVGEVSQIARQADNLHWLLDILIDRQIADDFLRTWASQTDLSEIHPKVPSIHRYEISRVTARLFIGIGKGQILVSKNTRCLLLRTWLDPFYEDFGWMRRACKGLDRHSIEDGLGNTILTLPLGTQQEILLAWFDRFLNSGDDCPNLQRGFEVWWRRAFWRRHGEAERQQLLRIAAANSKNQVKEDLIWVSTISNWKGFNRVTVTSNNRQPWEEEELKSSSGVRPSVHLGDQTTSFLPSFEPTKPHFFLLPKLSPMSIPIPRSTLFRPSPPQPRCLSSSFTTICVFSSSTINNNVDPFSFPPLEIIGQRSSLLSHFDSLQRPYKPFPVIGWNRHLETIFAAFYRSVPDVALRRECIRTKDDGSVALDWVLGDDSKLPFDSPVLILLPGLTGGSHDSYVRHMLVKARRKGWRVVVFNSRGCADSPVTTPQFYSASFTGDLIEVVDYVRKCYSKSRIYAVGWSLGANILVRYLAQESKDYPLSGAVSLCNPFNLVIADEDFHKGFNNIYDKALARSLRRIFKRHALLFEGIGGSYNIPLAASAKTVREFDEGLTRVSFGFTSVDDYYFNSSSSLSVKDVRTPLLCIQAENDPIAPSRGIPRQEIKENPHCMLIVTPQGGHLGWVAGEEAPFGAPWTDSVVLEYLELVEREISSCDIPDYSRQSPQSTGVCNGVIHSDSFEVPSSYNAV